MAVKAYFIGGSLDLTAKMLPRHHTPTKYYLTNPLSQPPAISGVMMVRNACTEQYDLALEVYNGPWGNFVVYTFSGIMEEGAEREDDHDNIA